MTTAAPCPVRNCLDAAGDPVVVEAGGLCPDHVRKAARALGQLPELYVKLSLGITGTTGGDGGDYVCSSRELKVPLSVAVRSLQEDMVRTVRDAETAWRWGQGLTSTPARGREGARLDGHVRFLAAHLAAMLDHPVGVELAVAVLLLRRRAVKALGLDRAVVKVAGTCPTCGTGGALHHDDGADHVLCHYCGRVVAEDEYERLGLVLGRAA